MIYFIQIKIIIFYSILKLTWTKNETISQPTNIYATNLPGINDFALTNEILNDQEINNLFKYYCTYILPNIT
jgi:hypothetical protein